MPESSCVLVLDTRCTAAGSHTGQSPISQHPLSPVATLTQDLHFFHRYLVLLAVPIFNVKYLLGT